MLEQITPVVREGQEGCSLRREGSGLQQVLKLVPSLGVQTSTRMSPQPKEGKTEYRGAGKRWTVDTWTVDVAVVTDGLCFLLCSWPLRVGCASRTKQRKQNGVPLGHLALPLNAEYSSYFPPR